MRRKEPQFSSTGMLLVTFGTVLGVGLWVAAIFGLGNSVTSADLEKNPPLQVDPNASSAAASGASASETGAATSSSASASSGGTYSSGSFTGLPFPVSTPTNTKLMDTSMPGYTIFSNTCAACHGQGLQGSIGPELLGIGNHATAQELLPVVTKGFPPMMPPAGGLSNPADVAKAVAWLAQQKQT